MSIKRKAREEWHGTYHTHYGKIEAGKEYDVRQADVDEPMWETLGKTAKIKEATK